MPFIAHKKIFVITLLLVALTGCRATLTLTPMELRSAKLGAVILKVGSPYFCDIGGIKIGVARRKGYKVVQRVQFSKPGKSREQLAEDSTSLTLKPGRYHILSFYCDHGRVANNSIAVSVGEPNKKGVYSRSFGHFSLRQGEVLNIGYLEIGLLNKKELENDVEKKKQPRLSFSVSAMPEAALSAARRDNPKLYDKKNIRTQYVKLK